MALDTANKPGDLNWTVSPTSLYVHIPFCASRCHYCDFTTYVAPDESRDAYVDALCREFSLLSSLTDSPLRTVFFGGGTPTLLSVQQIARVLSALSLEFRLADGAEVTMEANPGTVNQEKLTVMREFGVNRLSYGAQTFDNRLLMAIGRLHDDDTIRRSVEYAQCAGFQRINVDLMFGLPEQTLADVEKSLTEVFNMDVEHVSAYWLKVEPGTPFAKWQEAGMLPLPGEDVEADMYDLVRQTLTGRGYDHYEVSNFAKPRGEARHNLVYWRNEPYLAAGVGAHGYVHGLRYENERSLSKYQRRLDDHARPIVSSYQTSVAESMENTMMLGLRLREGVSKDRFQQQHGVGMETVFADVIDKLIGRGLLTWEADSLYMTERAWPLANLVFEEFVAVASDN